MSKRRRYDQLPKLVAFNRPRTIIEVGVYNAARAGMMCREALKHRDTVHYTGYDLFDSDEPTGDELNSKGRGSIEKAVATLDKIKSEYPGFSYELVKGNTHKTLHGRQVAADFVFIDGGHSVETIRGDYEALKTSRLIVLDDYYIEGVDTAKYGCNTLLTGVPHVLLPQEDWHGPWGIMMAAVGYDPRWIEALEKIVAEENMDTVAFWRGEDFPPTDLVAVTSGMLERQIDVEAALESIWSKSPQKIFFVINPDVLRTLDSWKSKLEVRFEILEWFPVAVDMVIGTAIPMRALGSFGVKGALTPDVRVQQAVENCAKVSKRVERNDVPHGRVAIIACYGPSLKDTWPTITTELKYLNSDLITVSAAHDYLIRREIIPDYHVECDPRPHKAKQIEQPQDSVKYLIASCCHPDMLKVLEGKDVSLWHMMEGQRSFEVLDKADPDGFLVDGGGSVGLRAISLFYALGYRNFRIHGMDSSFEGETQHAGKHAGKKQHVIQVRCGGKEFNTSAVLAEYADQFFQMLEHLPGAEIELHGNGLLQSWAKLRYERFLKQQEKVNAA